jgi:asparagine synthase (glutamine-hydrolysing)
MCGIAGRVTSGEPVDQALVERMCDSILHRGPDSQGIHVEGPVGLGMRRLAIIDLVCGDQPIYSEDREVVLVLNGEIYNHVELRDELRARGHTFAGGSDAEVVVHLWEELGPRCVERLRGMFAFALWDNRARELFLARDRLGKKPLFWAHERGALSFASEPRALFQDPALPRTVDPRAIDAYLVTQYVPHSLSAFERVRKLPPASALRWRPGGEPRVERYWQLEYGPKEAIGEAEAVERLRELLLEAARIRLMSDVPLGAFLSGGADSSAVVAAMAMTSPDPVKTFSVRFPYTGFDESPYARAVAEHYSTDHHELEIGRPDPSLLPVIAWHFGEPFADPAALPTFQLSELTRRHVTVALSGDGGDESFAGYKRYAQLAATLRADRLPAGARRRAAAALRRLAGGTDGRAPLPRAARLAQRLAMSPPHRYADLFRFIREEDREALYGPWLREAAREHDPLAHVERAWNARAGLEPIDRVMAVDLETYLSDDLLPKVDVTSMAHSLEVRSPFLDHHLMEFAARLPVSYKRRGDTPKWLLREAVRDWLPPGHLERDKLGFAVPIASWLREELAALPEQILLDPVAVERGVFEPAAVRRMITEHREGKDRSQQLWAMTCLELFFLTCVDASPATPAQIPALA